MATVPRSRVRGIVPCAVLLFALIQPQPAKADTANVGASQDAELRQVSPDFNNGSGATAVSGRVGNNLGADDAPRRALFRFELTNSVPHGAVISSVSLRLTVSQKPGLPASSTFGLHRILVSWSEDQVTWNARATASLWTAPGLDSAADAVGDASSTAFVAASDVAPTNYTFPATPALIADVQGWVDDPAANHGWLLKSSDEVTLRTARHFTTHENINFDKPLLTVEFIPPAPPILITNFGISEGQMVFEFTAGAGREHYVEHAARVSGSEWIVLTNLPVLEAPEVIAITDPLTSTGRLYRVRATP